MEKSDRIKPKYDIPKIKSMGSVINAYGLHCEPGSAGDPDQHPCETSGPTGDPDGPICGASGTSARASN